MLTNTLTLRGPDPGGSLVNQPSRSPVRLVVTAETSSAVDEALVEAIYLARKKINKAELTDAAIRIGLRHLDEVAALIREEEGETPHEE